MKAAYIEETGGPDVIQIGDLPMPAVGANDVLVKVKFVAVDPIDTYIRRGTYKLDLPVPFVIGRDMVGAVAEIGCAVTNFKAGDQVWCNNQGYAGRQGTFAEFISVNSQFLYHLPFGADPAKTVAVLHSALTAIVGLYFKAELQSGQTIFINGGSGNVGTIATQLAKALGAKVAVTAGSAEKAKWCKENGADLVIDYKKEDVSKALRTFAPSGVNVYWDLSPKPDMQKALDVIARRGRVLLSSGLMQQTGFKVGDFYTHNVTAYGFTITDLDVSELSQSAGVINQQLASNTMQARIAEVAPLSDAARAHELVESGDLPAKMVLQVE